MAEASMEDRPSQPQRFFCHMCNVHFQNATVNFTCPHCSNGFIEELEVNSADIPDDILLEDANSSDDEMLQVMIGNEVAEAFLPSFARSVSAAATAATGRGGASRGAPPSSSSRRPRYITARRGRYADVRHHRHRSRVPEWHGWAPRSVATAAGYNYATGGGVIGGGVGGVGGGVGGVNYATSPFENLIQDFIVNLGGVGWTDGGNMHLLLGNPGDYAWGREGLDAIVTQLLNQMDSSGPPPLQTDAIAALPLIEINAEQVNSKLQCSVCWEDFKLKEEVKQLPCQHVYHDSCIKPWLTLHGTCPICRKVLTEEGELQPNSEGQQANNASGNSTFNTLQQLFQAVQHSTGGEDATSSTSPTSTTRDGSTSSTDGTTGSTSNTNSHSNN